MNLVIFSTTVSKNTQISNYKKICTVGPELFHANRWPDRRTGRHDEANSRFSQFCERAQKTYASATFEEWN
jgi:hypothetical protein